MGLLRGVARTAVVAGTATAVSNRVSRRQAGRWAAQEQEAAPPPEDYPPQQAYAGGEQRLSNFLLWESAYSELYFSDRMWPDFDREELERALDDYASRQYRFGGR